MTGQVLTGAMTDGNRALRSEPDDLDHVQLLLERPFPSFGDVLITVSQRYDSAGSRVWLSLDGTVLRAQFD